jgi:hypothetical protein
MNTRNFILAAAVMIGLPACDSDTKKTEATKTVTKTDVKKVDIKSDVKTDTKTVAEKPVADPTKDEPKADPNAEKVKLAATVAREISGAPDQADEILAKHSLDRDKLDTLMFEIAGDPDLTKAYMAARRDT